MAYDEELLVELIAEGRLTHGRIAEEVGASRRTVWLIANGRSRPDLQQQIADTVEGYRQAAVRAAARHMTAVIEKQVEVALSDAGETARKCREFLIKTFMMDLPAQTARAEKEKVERTPADRPHPLTSIAKRFDDLSDELKDRLFEELDLPRPNIDETTGEFLDPPGQRHSTADLSAGRRDLSADRRDSTDGYGHGDGVCHEIHEPARRVGGPARRGGRRESETATTNDLRPEANTQHSTRNTQVSSDDKGNGGGDGAEDAGRKKVDPYHRLPGETVIEASRRHMRETSERLLAEYAEDQASRPTGRCRRRS